ncbi:O-antigen ligase family protein, partial [uncultured Flavobacterium sp.]|uniref:O-antigen ligase family protein n=1 Tax=uncultured Flavobacterium sp. TaxID=165435 RepID=UPI0030EE7977
DVVLFFYILMIISWLWSIDKALTLEALLKEIPLLIIPICFILCKDIIILNKDKILKYYSYSIVVLAVFFLTKAIYNYFLIKDLSVFFFHNLVTKELNAVHFSVFVTLALFYFLTKDLKKINDYILVVFLLIFLLLLSSKNIILSTILLSGIYFFYYSKSANKMRLRNIIILGVVLLSVLSFSLIKERLIFEFKIKEESNIGHTVINKKEIGSNIISMKEAWYNEKFNQTDYFSGSSFRVYQTRLFFEFLQEDNIFWKGFGLNASYKKLEEKGIHYNVFQGNNQVEGYQKKNFHNQYIQVFAELGVFGLLILFIILYVNLKKAIKHKDFMHIAFAVLMISLFLTESFLWRQRGVVFFTAFYCLFNYTKKE